VCGSSQTGSRAPHLLRSEPARRGGRTPCTGSAPRAKRTDSSPGRRVHPWASARQSRADVSTLADPEGGRQHANNDIHAWS
jgi:hypothetical protein